MTVIDEIAAERCRQIEAEKWTYDHDDGHVCGEMAQAAGVYAIGALLPGERDRVFARYWPWNQEWFKPKNSRHDLIRAAALIVAEIERLDRAAEPAIAPAASKPRIVMLIDDKPIDTLIEANPKGIAHFAAVRDLLHALFETVPVDRLPAPVVEAMSRLPDIGPTLNAYYRPDNKHEDVQAALAAQQMLAGGGPQQSPI